jgi:HSP20 family molecular chaperone IbpA
MNRALIFDSPFLLGFDQTRDLIERVAKAAADSYPPYNVEETGPSSLRITVAVAGFSTTDLDVRVEANQLTIAGKREGGTGADKAPDRTYVHRGIAARAFSRTFVLADGMEVAQAALEHGLLHVDLTRVAPEAAIKRIPIQSR